MRRVEIVELDAGDGDIIHAEVEIPASGDVARWRERLSGEALAADLARISRWLVTRIREALPEQPDKVGLEFGLKLSAKAGKLVGVLAEAGAEASIVVKLEWTHR